MWAIFVSLFVFTCVLESNLVESLPVESATDKYAGPVMVPVSSTVIPIYLFGRPKPTQKGRYLSPERRARLFDRSSRPETPVRLITKNSKAKDALNETH